MARHITSTMLFALRKILGTCRLCIKTGVWNDRLCFMKQLWLLTNRKFKSQIVWLDIYNKLNKPYVLKQQLRPSVIVDAFSEVTKSKKCIPPYECYLNRWYFYYDTVQLQCSEFTWSHWISHRSASQSNVMKHCEAGTLRTKYQKGIKKNRSHIILYTFLIFNVKSSDTVFHDLSESLTICKSYPSIHSPPENKVW